MKVLQQGFHKRLKVMEGHGGKQNQVCDLKRKFEREALYRSSAAGPQPIIVE